MSNQDKVENAESTDKKEKKKNPVLSFLTKNVFKPVDTFFDNVLKTVENVGLTQQIQYPYYLTQDWFWWSVGKQLFNFEIFGSENIPPEGQAAVVCMNHESLLDPLYFGVAVTHYSRRILHIMAKIELFKMPLINSYIRWIYAFPVRRGEHDEIAYQTAVDFLKRGELVGIYPEGTTNGGGYNFLPPKVGAARMAIDAGVPIIPIGMTGVGKVLPRGARTVNFNSKVTANIGEPIWVHEKYIGSNPTKEQLEEVMAHVMSKIKDLLFY
ncbi:MAG: lysophospholipid acyltransferase family protein [Promethearchaeota archaeon]